MTEHRYLQLHRETEPTEFTHRSQEIRAKGSCNQHPGLSIQAVCLRVLQQSASSRFRARPIKLFSSCQVDIYVPESTPQTSIRIIYHPEILTGDREGLKLRLMIRNDMRYSSLSDPSSDCDPSAASASASSLGYPAASSDALPCYCFLSFVYHLDNTYLHV